MIKLTDDDFYDLNELMKGSLTPEEKIIILKKEMGLLKKSLAKERNENERISEKLRSKELEFVKLYEEH